MKEIFKDKLSDGRTVILSRHDQKYDTYEIEITNKDKRREIGDYHSDTHIFRGEGSIERAWSFISNLFPGRVFEFNKNEFVTTKEEVSKLFPGMSSHISLKIREPAFPTPDEVFGEFIEKNKPRTLSTQDEVNHPISVEDLEAAAAKYGYQKSR